ncbi:SpoIIE family protein phosphatase [Modestobacter sp. VKM Ac-2986]|uniref:SpoIIE family protein phosphatase n=1 Tax=Modestobacter sp. VKM Ac-2986 TaxID=3004140 RepID=UPI0022AAB912|nr:SpoIIE family protein phosphatase [Modestobacter sp. VKM Ac-2986]MCZ2827523.1 SpoIIE family protein phosphatase [Modestobacter sp. VKM Ac-2986]
MAEQDGVVREQDDVVRLVESLPVGYLALDADWTITYVNAAAERSLGHPGAELVGVSMWTAFPDNERNEFGRTYREALATGEPRSVEAYYPAPYDQWFQAQAVPTGTGLALFFTDVTDRRKAQERLALLARVSAQLAGSVDDGSATARLPQLLVPALADWCVLTVVDEEDRPHDVGWWHADPDRRAVVARYAAVRLASVPAGAPVVRALAGETVVSPVADVLALLPPGPARDLIEQLDTGSGLAIPLRGRDRVLGVLTLCFDRGREPVDADLLVARQVADRIGQALDNARLFRQQRQLAETLQRSLLTRPVQHEGAQIAVRYAPAAEAARIGGDWYDAFRQPSGSLMLVIGDVVGHDTAAAAAMGQLRALLRGIATYSDAGPVEVLRGLDSSMELLSLGTYATAAVARFERTPAEAGQGLTRMRWTNAGHLPPLVIHPDGTLAAPAAWRGELLLGVDPGAERSEAVLTLPAGSTVLLYTDGLIERRDGDLDDGMERLREAATELAGASLDELCDQLIARLVDGRPEDDVALVAIRLLA